MCVAPPLARVAPDPHSTMKAAGKTATCRNRGASMLWDGSTLQTGRLRTRDPHHLYWSQIKAWGLPDRAGMQTDTAWQGVSWAPGFLPLPTPPPPQYSGPCCPGLSQHPPLQAQWCLDLRWIHTPLPSLCSATASPVGESEHRDTVGFGVQETEFLEGTHPGAPALYPPQPLRRTQRASVQSLLLRGGRGQLPSPTLGLVREGGST